MNVALAFQFFNVHDALEIYKNTHEDLEDCEGTIASCKTITKLNKAMNSRTPAEALSPGNEVWNTIENFLAYLTKWEADAKKEGADFMSESCCYGLKVSLRAALEICQFLVEKCNFKYLMTGRLNQDCLERFLASCENVVVRMTTLIRRFLCKRINWCPHIL
ncbi:uncharacterized protein LOC122508805 isoform X2 [Leptopilina heterotoma]|uniref:uncharacterized protein LOC122508805 isoform X2 n=1 Tax=Leptopilina heterotoma TaxID=63436 RepID=UPI001CA7D450|nr:uncharacterized protein LOC122508805 isoform X2 [Leptopilina heterotoma]